MLGYPKNTIYMKQNNWRVIAIIFIVLCILEALVIIYCYNLGTKMIDNDNECSFNTCSGYETYSYDMYSQICSCYVNNQKVFSTYLKYR